MKTMQPDDREQIRQMYLATTRLLKAGDIQTLATYYTDDAIQFPPNRPPLEGWSEISASLENELSGIIFNSTLDVREVVITGDSGYAWGHFQAVITPMSGQTRSVTSGSFLDVLRRHTDGSWRIARSMWSNHELED